MTSGEAPEVDAPTPIRKPLAASGRVAPAVPGVGREVSADLLDDLIGVAMQTKDGQQLLRGWLRGVNLPLTHIYTISPGPGKITAALPRPAAQG